MNANTIDDARSLFPAPAAGRDDGRRADRRAWLAFVIVPPVVWALPLAWHRAGLAQDFTLSAALTLWFAQTLASWWLSLAATAFAARVLRPLDPSPWLLLTLGYHLNVLLASVYTPAIVREMSRLGWIEATPMVTHFFSSARSLSDPAYLRALLIACLPGFLYWLFANLLFEKFTGKPRTRRAAPNATPAQAREVAPPTVAPPFFGRLARLGGLTVDELVALEAEDHYVMIHSTRGKELLYYRFGDALAEVAALDGLQIHRSAWVRRTAIAKTEEVSRTLYVELVTGHRLRVSQSNRGAVLRSVTPARSA